MKRQIVFFLAIFCVVLLHDVNLFAQNQGVVLSWNAEVGCLLYDDEPRKEITFIETVKDDSCINVCEQSTVLYSILGENIVQVEWNITGGLLINTSTATWSATVAWGNRGSGLVHVKITHADQSISIKRLCVEVIPKPKAKFTIANMNAEMDQVACAEVPLIFTNLSQVNGGSQLVSYLWNFGDGTFSSEFEPTHIYSHPGHYTVTLEVRNECNCVSQYKLNVFIKDRSVPILCPTVVCEGDTETYVVDAQKCPTEWKVNGGEIIHHDEYSVQVQWNEVDESGFGYLHAFGSCACPSGTVEKVPVILKKGKIQGEQQLCVNEQYRYKLPQWPGTFFNWSISPSSGASVIQTDQVNEAIVSVSQSGTYVLKCSYSNELAGCSGEAELILTAQGVLHVLGEREICQYATAQYSSNFPNTFWQLKMGNSVLNTHVGSTYTYQFSQAELYHLVASSSGACRQAVNALYIHPVDSLSGNIVGDLFVCKGQPYNYSFSPESSSYILDWSAVGGTVKGSNAGEEIVVLFDDQPPISDYYEVQVRQKLKFAPFCTSHPLTLKVQPKKANISIINVENLTTFCSSSYTSFTYHSDFMENVEDITWLLPDGFGNVISGWDSDTVHVSFNEHPGATGVLVMKVRFCGDLQELSFPITLQATPQLTWMDSFSSICSGSSNTFNLSFTSNIPISSGVLVWTIDNNTYTQAITSPTISFTSPQLSFPNANDVDITKNISVTVQQANGCQNAVSLYRTITVLPSPRIKVTPGYHYELCLETDNNFTIPLTANLQDGLTSVGDIEWYKLNGQVPQQINSGLSNNGMNIVLTQAYGLGMYYAQATSSNGCTEKSQTIQLVEKCPESCPLSFIANVNASLVEQTSCQKFTLQGSADPTPDNISWSYPIGNGIAMLSSDNNIAEFEVSTPGDYVFFYRVHYNNALGEVCIIDKAIPVHVPYVPDISYEIECLNNGLFGVKLWDNSTHVLTDLNNLNYTFSVNGQTVGSTSNVPFFNTSLGAGSYEVGVVLSHPNYPTIASCSAQASFTLYAPPDPTFNVGHNPPCQELAAIFSVVNDVSSVHSYKWTVDNNDFIIHDPINEIPTLLNVPRNINNDSEDIKVTLTITDPNGCTTSFFKYVPLSKEAKFEGEINSDTSLCVGNVATLTYVLNDGQSPTAYQWVFNKELLVGATSVSYSPTQNGAYWAILYDDDGCSYKKTMGKTVTFYPTPSVSIEAPTTICVHEPFTLQGFASGKDSLVICWYRNGETLHPCSTNTDLLTLQTMETTPGTYTYRLEVSELLDVGCSSWVEFVVTVLAVPSVTIGYDILSCSPYQIKLSAHASTGEGTYLWSNGTHGQSMIASSGGAYRVKFLVNNGCEVTQQIFVPKNPEIYTWLFPSGCVELCPEQLANNIHLPAPNAPFHPYSWSINHEPHISGYGFSPNYVVQNPGYLDVKLSNELGCSATSKPLSIEIVPCQKCDLKWWIGRVIIVRDPYWHYVFSGEIYNSFGTDIILEFSSPQGHGFYNPPSAFVPIGESFPLESLSFIPSESFMGGETTLQITIRDKNGKIICILETEIDLPPMINHGVVSGMSLHIVPNPTTGSLNIAYHLNEYEQGTLKIMDMQGIQHKEFVLNKKEGTVFFDTTPLPPGNYLVVLLVEGQAIEQQTVIKI